MVQTREKLKNGLQLMHYHLPATNSVTTCFIFRVGATAEQTKEYGMAHFIEHTIFGGSKKYPDEAKTRTMLEKYGIIDNAWTFKDITNYWMKAPVQHFEKVVTILADRIGQPLFKDIVIEKERGIVLQEIHMGNDSPGRVAWMELNKALFKGTQYAHPVIGNTQSVSSFTRKMVLDFFSKNYTNDNLAIWVGGNIAFNDAKKIVECISLPRTEKREQTKANNKKTESAPHVVFKKMDTQVYTISIGFDGFDISQKHLDTLILASALLGAGKGSKLYRELKIRKGLVTDVDAEIIPFSHNGVLTIDFTAIKKNVKKALQISLDQLQQVASQEISNDELERAQNVLLADFVKLQESSEYFGQSYSFFNLTRRELLSNKPVDFDMVLSNIKSADKNLIGTALTDILTKSKCAVSAAGPEKGIVTEIETILDNFSL